MRKPRILIADDHRIVLEGLQKLLEHDFEIVGTADNGQDLIEYARQLRPDVAVVDISMPKLNGIEAARKLRQASPETRILILSMHSDPRLVEAALRAGAQGYLLKRSAAEELAEAIHKVWNGQRYISPWIARQLLEGLDEPTEVTEARRAAGQLTPRQKEVLRLIGQGKTTREIAAELGLSPRTVEFHKRCIMNQLGLHSSAALIRYAVRYGESMS